jgi:Spy/CpxP family protein refolding chaperone
MKQLLFIAFTISIVAVAALAQDVEAVSQNGQPKRPNLMQALGLSIEQVQTIRKINKDQKPKMDAAQNNLRIARKALDDAVYAEELVESNVQTKNKAFQFAQAEVSTVKTETELAIRKVLNAEQLVKFRELRLRLIRANNQPARPKIQDMKRFPNRQR